MKRLDEEFNKIFDLIYSKQNFALLRYGDGERAIAHNYPVHAQEGWKVEQNAKFSAEMRECFKLKDERIIHAISCPCCDMAANFYYQSRILGANLSLANVFVNINQLRFKDAFERINEDAILIANHRAKGHKIGNLNIIKHYEISDDCNEFYNNHLDAFCSEIIECNYQNMLFIISAGPLAEIIIKRLFTHNPNNRYIDVGSAIDRYFKPASELRDCTKSNSIYAARNCVLDCSAAPKISVLLTLHKRPYVLERQLEAVLNQSLRPSEVLLYQDGVFADINISDELKDRFDGVFISEQAQGVWQRFLVAHAHAQGEFVVVFDDDTIPGVDFFANCYEQFCKAPGLYGTNGVLLKDAKKYPRRIQNIGWKAPNEVRLQVDFVGHAWFAKREWLGLLGQAPAVLKQRLSGEDIALSLMLQRIGVASYVPPHPAKRLRMWGSLPEDANKLGTDSAAISMNATNLARFNIAMKEALAAGFSPLKECNKAAYKHALNMGLPLNKRIERGAKRLFRR